jgi:hypothetical protein
MSYYKSRIVQTRKEIKIPTWDEFDDVRRACHKWLMKNDGEYRMLQQQLPERMRLANWNEDGHASESKMKPTIERSEPFDHNGRIYVAVRFEGANYNWYETMDGEGLEKLDYTGEIIWK